MRVWIAAATIALFLTVPSFAAPTKPPAQPEVKHWWSCQTKLKKAEKKGRVCAKDEQSAIEECGVELCDLDLVCQSACSCSDAHESC